MLSIVDGRPELVGELRAADPERTRERGMREFLDEKKFRPGLEPVKRPAGEK